jgi:RNA polymerase primary sigma factor
MLIKYNLLKSINSENSKNHLTYITQKRKSCTEEFDSLLTTVHDLEKNLDIYRYKKNSSHSKKKLKEIESNAKSLDKVDKDRKRKIDKMIFTETVHGSILMSKKKTRSESFNVMNVNRHKNKGNSNRVQLTSGKKMLIHNDSSTDSDIYRKDTFTRHSSSRFDISRHSRKMKYTGLLTASGEKKYGKLVQQLVKIESVDRYVLDNKGRYPTLKEIATLFNMDTKAFIKLKTVCAQARQRMMDCNVRLVISVAKKIHKKRKGFDLNDLVIVGMDGLTRAVEKFDPSKGYKFSTYAHWWIRQAIDRYILEQRTIKVPVHLWEILSKIRKAQRALRDNLGREPTYNEVGTLLGLDSNRVEHIVQAYYDTESLDVTLNGSNSDPRPLEETIENNTDERDHHKAFELSDTKIKLKIDTLIKATLTERESEIVRMRYGLDDGIPRTLDEIGERFQVTRERVRQIETKIARKFKLNKERSIIHKELYGLLESRNKSFTKVKATS